MPLAAPATPGGKGRRSQSRRSAGLASSKPSRLRDGDSTSSASPLRELEIVNRAEVEDSSQLIERRATLLQQLRIGQIGGGGGGGGGGGRRPPPPAPPP